MEDLFEFLIILGFMVMIATSFFLIVQFFRLKLKKLKQEIDEEKDLDQVGVLKKDIGYLMAENEEIRDELRNIKYLLSQDAHKQPIDIKEYEKQQIEIDKRNKFEL
jgi:regulator of replication initiation timing